MFVAPVLQPLRTGIKLLHRCRTPVIGESEFNKEVQVCTQLSKLAASKLK